jgi:ATP:ADP antiporter, AAA family
MKKPSTPTSQSAEKDSKGQEYLAEEPWQKMGTTSTSAKATAYLDALARKVTGGLEGEDLIKVLWLSGTLFFIVGGYWLLRSLKDPIMTAINGVRSVPQRITKRARKLILMFLCLGGVYPAG